MFMHISLISGWILLSPSVFSLVRYMASLKVYKENLTLHSYSVEVVRSTPLALHTIMDSP